MDFFPLPVIVVAGSFSSIVLSALYHGYHGCDGEGKRRVSDRGTRLPSYFRIVRVVACVLLVVTSALAGSHENTGSLGIQESRETFFIPIIYGSILNLLSVFDHGRRSHLTRHVDIIFLSVFATAVYHDIWPFFTLNGGSSHTLGFKRVIEDALLGLLGIVLPLTSPREYHPINDAAFLEEPHPEQTASLFSLLIFSWLNPLISVAYKSKHLAAEALYPLADSDRIASLVSRNSVYFGPQDGNDRSHVFFGLLKTFWPEYVMLLLIVLLQVRGQHALVRCLITVEIYITSALVSPFALEQYLRYIETGGNGATIRPIVWIILLFLGPIVRSLSYQWFDFVATRVAVHAEALLSDLIFKHSLRIRLQTTKNGGTSDEESHGESNLMGTINNHVTTDLTNVTGAKDFLPIAFGIPLQIVLCVVFLHRMLGWSALVGAASMVILFPVPGYIARLFKDIEIEKMKKTDSRVQVVTETMNVLRMIKLFGWERKMSNRLEEQRVEELSWTRKRTFLNLMNNMIIFIIPIVVMLITYSVYTAVAGQKLTASLVFSSIAVFEILQLQLHIVANALPRFMQGKVALDRINGFLKNDDVIIAPSINDADFSPLESDNYITDSVGISHAAFSWSKPESSQNEQFMLRIPDELVFRSGELNLITGPTGSGKTSLLMALLGEMHFCPSRPSSWVKLPRHLGVAYAAQESWILNQTIRDNILFDSAFDEGRYKDVLFQCALEPDLAQMEHGDLTEVGERGVTLSGGQKARITLARAIYSKAHTLLLDDVFAALDVHTSRWIVSYCFRGDLVKGRTIIMATHHVSLVNDIARYVVTLDNDGQIQNHGPLSVITNENARIVSKEQNENYVIDGPMSDSTSAKSHIGTEGETLVAAEEIAEGHVGWPAVFLYLVSWGGHTPLLNWFLFVFGLTVTHMSKAAQSWYLGYWAEQYQETTRVDVGWNVVIYTAIMWSTVILYVLSCTVNLFGSLRASKTIHQRLVEKIFGATFRWLDMTPVARVITRCTQDIGSVDGTFSQSLSELIEITVLMLVKLTAVVYFAPPFLLPGLVVAVLGGWCGQVYMKAELSVKRELSNAKAPMLAHLGTALAGLVSVRAFGAQAGFIKEYHSRIDHYTRVARTFYAFNCWVSLRLKALGALFSAALASYLMYGHHKINPSNVGFSLEMAMSFSEFILWWIITYNNTEINGNSLERIANYLDIEQESKISGKTSPPAYWPASGDLRVKNLSARYSTNGTDVLHGLSFHINAGERVGVVGRTGSGKSSLTLSLLRCLPTEGEVYYDGVLTSSIELDALRSSLTIVPQSAELLAGTIRQNLDPFGQFEDPTLYNALQSAGLSELQELNDDGRLTLDSSVIAGGTNLSAGQRQIVGLARAMVRESKLLILDEATSAIDHKTDAVIQRTLREMKGVTQLIVAHRLQSVMDCDRIMVLDVGHIVEFDAPGELLQREESLFRTLVYASQDKDNLLASVNSRQKL